MSPQDAASMGPLGIPSDARAECAASMGPLGIPSDARAECAASMGPLDPPPNARAECAASVGLEAAGHPMRCRARTTNVNLEFGIMVKLPCGRIEIIAPVRSSRRRLPIAAA